VIFGIGVFNLKPHLQNTEKTEFLNSDESIDGIIHATGKGDSTSNLNLTQYEPGVGYVQYVGKDDQFWNFNMESKMSVDKQKILVKGFEGDRVINLQDDVQIGGGSNFSYQIDYRIDGNKIYRNTKSGLTWRGEYLEMEVEGDKVNNNSLEERFNDEDPKFFTFRI
jgi:hypothetical protein